MTSTRLLGGNRLISTDEEGTTFDGIIEAGENQLIEVIPPDDEIWEFAHFRQVNISAADNATEGSHTFTYMRAFRETALELNEAHTSRLSIENIIETSNDIENWESLVQFYNTFDFYHTSDNPLNFRYDNNTDQDWVADDVNFNRVEFRVHKYQR